MLNGGKDLLFLGSSNDSVIDKKADVTYRVCEQVMEAGQLVMIHLSDEQYVSGQNLLTVYFEFNSRVQYSMVGRT